MTEFIEQYGAFFDQDLPANPFIVGAGYAFVRAYLFRILVMFEWCRVDASVRNQLIPLIRNNLIEISEWPKDFFREKEMEFLEDMRQRFRL